jgi:hypothetical protein
MKLSTEHSAQPCAEHKPNKEEVHFSVSWPEGERVSYPRRAEYKGGGVVTQRDTLKKLIQNFQQ